MIELFYFRSYIFKYNSVGRADWALSHDCAILGISILVLDDVSALCYSHTVRLDQQIDILLGKVYKKGVLTIL